MVGVAILCYEGYKDLVMSLNAVKKRTSLTGEQVEFIVFDNSERTTKIESFVKEQHPDVIYHKPGKNLGCTESRNIIYHEFLKRHPDAKYLVILDQDIEVLVGWLADMIEVAEAHDDCGVVAWPQAYRLRPEPVNGIVSEVASMCNLHVIEPLRQVEAKWGGPFDERFFFHKFDSLICQRLNQLDFRTRLVTKYNGKPSKPKLDLIIHHHPHQGVRRHPKCKQIISRSKKLYVQLQHDENWQPWYPTPTRPASRPVTQQKDVPPAPKRRQPQRIRIRQPMPARRPTAVAPPPKVKKRVPPKPRRTLKQLIESRKR